MKKTILIFITIIILMMSVSCGDSSSSLDQYTWGDTLIAPDGTIYINMWEAEENGWSIATSEYASKKVGEASEPYHISIYKYKGDEDTNFLWITDHGDPALGMDYVREDYVFPEENAKPYKIEFSRIYGSEIKGRTPKVTNRRYVTMFYDAVASDALTEIDYDELKDTLQGSIDVILDTAPKLETAYSVYAHDGKYYMMLGWADDSSKDNDIALCAELEFELLEKLTGHSVEVPVDSEQSYL